MHCTNCGTYIAPGTRFCAGCGAAAEDPEVTRLARPTSSNLPRPSANLERQSVSVPARNDDEYEAGRTIFNTRPTLLFIKLGYVLAALGAILLTILLASFTTLKISAFIAVPIAMALLLIPAYYHVRRNSIRYRLTDSEIEIDQGLVARTTRNIPLRTIQDVTVSATIPQRLLGYGDLIIDNASEQGGKLVLHNIQDPRRHADLLLRELRRWR
jgi:membrane protein YdbS with pleckstrin-like domain